MIDPRGDKQYKAFKSAADVADRTFKKRHQFFQGTNCTGVKHKYQRNSTIEGQDCCWNRKTEEHDKTTKRWNDTFDLRK